MKSVFPLVLHNLERNCFCCFYCYGKGGKKDYFTSTLGRELTIYNETSFKTATYYVKDYKIQMRMSKVKTIKSFQSMKSLQNDIKLYKSNTRKGGGARTAKLMPKLLFFFTSSRLKKSLKKK